MGQAAASSVTTRQFLEAIWGPGPGVAELAIFSRDKKPENFFGFKYPESIDAFVLSATRHNGKSNVHMGVTLRKPGTEITRSKRGKELDTEASACCWVDIDFKRTPREEALKLATEFPQRPSIVVKSGGGVHLYWLLRELATGDDLKRVKRINRGLARALKGDPESTDLARLLRVPSTLNVKDDYPVPVMCEVSGAGWRPDLQYNLSDFDHIAAAPDPTTSPSEPSEPRTSQEFQDLHLSDCEKISKGLENLWTQGWRHEMAMDVAGALAHSGVSLESARSIIRMVSDTVGGDTAGRVKDAEDTYRKFLDGKPTKGFSALERRVEEFAGDQKERMLKQIVSIRKLMPKRKPKGATPLNFKVLEIIKYDSRPARHTVTMEHVDGRTFQASAETIDFFEKYSRFQTVVYEQTGVVLDDMSNPRWHKAIAQAPHESRPAPKEASPTGALERALDEFLKGKRENPKVGDLKSFPGYDDQEEFFKMASFRSFAKDHGVQKIGTQVYQHLEHTGWESKAKRIGEDVVWVWKRGLNGHGAPQNGIHAPEPPQGFGEIPLSTRARGEGTFFTQHGPSK